MVNNIKDKEKLIELGERIRERRLKLGLSQMELAQLSNISQGNISKIENGTQAMTLFHWLDLNEVLKLGLRREK